MSWNYSSRGVYFVTFVVHRRLRILSSIVEGTVQLTRAGEVVEECLRQIPRIHPGVQLERFVVMPDHVHTLLWLDNPLTSLDQILGAFKSVTARQINKLLGRAGRGIWQRSYHDRIVRTRRELHAVRRYIDDNPARWPG